MYTVFMNDVKSGEISEEEYKAIKDAVISDKRMYLSQGLNIVNSIISLSALSIKALIVSAVVMTVAAGFYMPEFVSGVIQKAPTDPDLVKGICEFYLYITGMVTFTSMSIRYFYMGDDLIPGFENKFNLEIVKRIRIACGIQATGNITLKMPLKK